MAAMALAPGDSEFDTWLGSKLRDLNMDESVFGTYIKSILNGEESNDEKAEALEGIISEITESDISSHCQEILDHWQNFVQTQAKPKPNVVDDVEDKLVKLLESQTLQTIQQREYTAEEKRIREAILAQYSQIQVQDEDDNNDIAVNDSTGLERNTNVQAIQMAERERREQAKLESKQKKDKDREDRDRQKQQAAEKKEKRKTQKGERRR